MTSQQRKPVYTDEVMQALREKGLTPEPDQPRAATVPEGSVQYLVVIGEHTEQGGVAAPAVVAAVLRSLADQMDPPRPHFRGVDLTEGVHA